MTTDVAGHYGRPGLGEAIRGALRAAGRALDALTPDDLAPVDHFHLRGRDATLELAALAGLEAGQRVLDVGGGIGGPARTVAHERRCHVTVLDLTEEFCRVGADLTQRVGLAGRVVFRHGDATAMPFADGTFDAALSQHASMNVADKPRLFGEIRRVLRPGGRYALHEIVAGAGGPIHMPVPWAADAALSHLRPADEIRRLLRDGGFTERAWHDESTRTAEWLRPRVAAGAKAVAPPPLGPHVLLGPLAGPMFRNVLLNLDEDRVRVVMAVWERA